MQEVRQRRSPRRDLELPIRVSGTDLHGKHFVEDSVTVVVSRHGAKIRLKHKLALEQQIGILFQGSACEALFRVVSKVDESTSRFSFWGVECLTPAEDIRDGSFQRASRKPGDRLGPRPEPRLDQKAKSKDKSFVQVTLRCSKCGMREQADLDASQIQAIRELKGLVRECPACGASTLWKPIAVQGSRSQSA